MTNLYEALEVSRTAGADEIKKSYRKKVKKVHPDTGGSRDQFALVKLALDTLSDDKRRAEYDRTGKTDAGGPDTTESEAGQVAFAAVDFVLNEIEKRGLDDGMIDVIADAVRTLEKNIQDKRANIRQLETKLKKTRRLAKRFKPKDGKPNIIGAMMEARIADLERGISRAEADIIPINRAIEILNDHTFDFTDITKRDYNVMSPMLSHFGL